MAEYGTTQEFGYRQELVRRLELDDVVGHGLNCGVPPRFVAGSAALVDCASVPALRLPAAVNGTTRRPRGSARPVDWCGLDVQQRAWPAINAARPWRPEVRGARSRR